MMEQYGGHQSFVGRKDNTRYIVIDDSELEVRHQYSSRGIIRSTCPLCRDGRQHSGDDSLSIFTSSGIGTCFHCMTGSTDPNGHQLRIILRSRLKPFIRSEKNCSIDIPQKVNTGELEKIHSQTVVNYLRGRGFGDLSVFDGLVYECSHYFADTGKDARALAFVYRLDGKIVNVQYKRLAPKHFSFAVGGAVIAFNQDVCRDNDEIFVTEGPLDALALIACGHKNVISVPNGAGTDIRKVFAPYAFTHYDHLKTIYVAGDSDDTGTKFRDALAAYFGEQRCRIVEWDYLNRDDTENFAAKDANECLQQAEKLRLAGCDISGKKAVDWCIANASGCSLTGVETARDYETVTDDWRRNGLPPSFGTGSFHGDRKMRFQEGRLMLLSGQPGTGKSTYAIWLSLSLAIVNGWNIAIWSPEKHPSAYMYKEIYEMLCGTEFRKIPQSMYEHAKQWTAKHIFNIRPKNSDVDSVLAAANSAVHSLNVKFLLLDPFNFFAKPKEYGLSDPDKISAMIQQIVENTRKENICTMLVAHPRKPSDVQAMQHQHSLYDVSGSADFYNKPDVGIWMERDDTNGITLIDVLKVRFDVLGENGTFAVWYNHGNHRYADCDNRGKSPDAPVWIKWKMTEGSIIPDESGISQQLPFISGEQPDGDNQQPDGDHPFGEEINNVPF